MNEKDFILNLLNLSNGVLQNNIAEISNVTNSLNGAVLTDDQKRRLKESIMSLVSDKNIDTMVVTRNMVKLLTCITTDIILVNIDLYMVNYNDRPALNIFISKSLDATLLFDNDYDKYNYYYRLSNVAIITNDIDLITKAINKVQSL